MTMLSLLFCSLPVLVDDDVVVRGIDLRAAAVSPLEVLMGLRRLTGLQE